MPPPPAATSSPHRFLPGQRKAQSSTKGTRPSSTLRNEVARRSFDDDTQSSQFAPTPRFSHGRPNARLSPGWSVPTDRSNLTQALRASTQHAEDVEAAADEDDEMLELEQEEGQARETTEALPTLGRSHHQWTNDLAFSPKRRRLQYSEAFSSPQQPARGDNTQSHTSHTPKDTETPRFAHSFDQATPSSTPAAAAVATAADCINSPHRPPFIRPSAAQQQPQEPSAPLPEVFSPHRRGQKFVPGGMAATVQQWVLETGQAAIQSRRGQGYLHGEEYVARAKITEEEGLEMGGGPCAVRAETMSGAGSIDLLLAGGKDVRKVESGAVIGIRAPVWEVSVSGRVWTVGVDWRVLS